MHPDYGTPGAPNLDPYYASPSQIAADEAECKQAIADAEHDLQGAVEDIVRGLEKHYGITLRAISVDVGNCAVTIETA